MNSLGVTRVPRRLGRIVAIASLLLGLAVLLAACGQGQRTPTDSTTNRAPTANDDAYGTERNVALDVVAPGVLGDDTDPDGDALTASLVGAGPGHGTLSLHADGGFTYTPDTDFVGTDAFSYAASDGALASAAANVTLTVSEPGGDEPDPSSDPALEVTAEPGYLDFRTGDQAAVSVRADGSWTAETDQTWLTIDPSSGSGDAVVTVRVSRGGLAPDVYAGSVLFRGAEPEATVEVLMGFPVLTGQLSHTGGTVQAGATLLASSDAHVAASEGASSGRAAPGEVVVGMNRVMVAWLERRSAEDLASQAASLSFEAVRSSARNVAADHAFGAPTPIAVESDLFVLDVPDVETAVQALRTDGRVAFATPNYLYEPLAAPNDPLYADQWHYAAIGLDASRDLTTGAERVVVGVIDGAIDTSHVDLASKLVPGFDFATNTQAIVTAPEAHGTHVAGTVAAATDNGVGVAGVAADARLMPLNVFPEGGGANSADVARALYFAAGACVYLSDGTVACGPAPVDAVNLSLGPQNPDCLTSSYDATMDDGLAYALGRGVALVAAAGNDACEQIGWPAESPTTIAISAVGPSSTLTDYSNRGQDIFLAAPGGDTSIVATDGVLSTTPGDGYAYLQGTSMASPHVAGVAALLRSVNPSLTPSEIYDVLARTATDLGIEGRDTFYGHGLVDAAAAVAEARSLLETPTHAFVARLTGPESRETQVGEDGSFAFADLLEGTYQLEVGNDVDGDGTLGDSGEFYATRSVTIDHAAGDVHVDVNAAAQ